MLVFCIDCISSSILLVKTSLLPLLTWMNSTLVMYKVLVMYFLLLCCWYFFEGPSIFKNVFVKSYMCGEIMIRNSTREIDLRQPASVRAKKHYYSVTVLWREWHLSTRHFNQYSRTAIHKHKHSVHPHQLVQGLQSTLPSRPKGRPDSYRLYPNTINENNETLII